MRVVTGFSSSPGDYFLQRATHEPPYSLQRQLWPWIEEWETRIEVRACRKSWAQGGLDEDDLAADGFLKLLRRLRVVLLQDLAMLQPQYPSLSFYSYAPFYGPEWDAFALVVRTDLAAAEPPNLLLQRALPELSGVLETSREAILHNSNQLASRLEQQLQLQLETRLLAIQGSLNALLQGQIPITFPGLVGYIGGAPGPGSIPMPVPVLTAAAAAGIAPSLGTAPAAASVPTPTPISEPGPPVVTALPKVFTVRDVWREWKEGVAGHPAIQELEERWGSRWRPGSNIRVQFCRRKVIWNELRTRIAKGRTEEEAITELEQLRGHRTINRLVDSIKQRQQRAGQEQLLPTLPPPPPQQLQQARRGRSNCRSGRWARCGRRGPSG